MPRDPLVLPAVTTGFAALSPAARAIGGRIAGAAADALGATIGHPVRLLGAARPLPFTPAVGAVRLAFALGALPAHGLLEVDARFAACAVDLLAGGSGAVTGGLALTPVEAAALELLALVALDGALAVPELEALAPRLVRGAPGAADSALTVDLAVEVGPVRGRARLAVPPAALAFVAGARHAAELPDEIGRWRVPASLRRGTATLAEEELATLAPGDVVLLDPDPAGDELLLPAGLVLTGRRDGNHFHVKESRMNEWTATFPVALSVEIARVELTLADLARLEPGGIVPLHVGREGLVTLRAGERAVARGQLVEIDGALGVRIDALEVGP